MVQESKAIPVEEVVNDFDKRIENFFLRMELNEHQKAMFYLGRVLSSVKYIQKEKKKTYLVLSMMQCQVFDIIVHDAVFSLFHMQF